MWAVCARAARRRRRGRKRRRHHARRAAVRPDDQRQSLTGPGREPPRSAPQQSECCERADDRRQGDEGAEDQVARVPVAHGRRLPGWDLPRGRRSSLLELELQEGETVPQLDDLLAGAHQLRSQPTIVGEHGGGIEHRSHRAVNRGAEVSCVVIVGLHRSSFGRGGAERTSGALLSLWFANEGDVLGEWRSATENRRQRTQGSRLGGHGRREPEDERDRAQ